MAYRALMAARAHKLRLPDRKNGNGKIGFRAVSLDARMPMRQMRISQKVRKTFAGYRHYFGQLVVDLFQVAPIQPEAAAVFTAAQNDIGGAEELDLMQSKITARTDLGGWAVPGLFLGAICDFPRHLMRLIVRHFTIAIEASHIGWRSFEYADGIVALGVYWLHARYARRGVGAHRPSRCGWA